MSSYIIKPQKGRGRKTNIMDMDLPEETLSQLGTVTVWSSDYRDVCSEDGKFGGIKFMNSPKGILVLSYINFCMHEYETFKFKRAEIYHIARMLTISEKRMSPEVRIKHMKKKHMEILDDEIPVLEMAEYRELFYLTTFFDRIRVKSKMVAADFTVDPVLFRQTVCKYSDLKSLILLCHKSKDDTVFDDLDVELFYEQLKVDFPSYHKVFKEIGVGERYWENKIKEGDYAEAYGMVQSQVNFSLRAEMIKKGKEEGNLPAINAALKESAEMDSRKEIANKIAERASREEEEEPDFFEEEEEIDVDAEELTIECAKFTSDATEAGEVSPL